MRLNLNKKSGYITESAKNTQQYVFQQHICVSATVFPQQIINTDRK